MTQENTKKKERENFQFRVTREEKMKFNEDAKEAGMTATDYFKWLAFEKPRRTKRANFDREILIRLSAELGKVGSNVNQIAKVMNTEKKTFYTVAVKETLIAEVLATVQTVSSDIFKHINYNYGSSGKDTGEWGATGDLSADES